MKKLFLIFIFLSVVFSSAIATYKIYTSKNTPQIPFEQIDVKTDFTKMDETTTEISHDVEKPSEENTTSTNSSEFIMPVNSSTFGMTFSNGKLIYSKTLNEWTTHNGIDIIGKLSEPVFATNDGIITNISSSSTDGIKITIEHENGYSSIYSNLSTTKLVNLNEKVKKGQVISGIGKTAEFEYEEPDHLHFEMYKDGLVIDPLSVIHENNSSFGYN